jgi:hypothetical protein
MTFYGQSTVPHHFTDGILRCNSGYSTYLSHYNTRRVISAPLTVTLLEYTLGANTAYVKVRVALEEDLPAGHTVYIGLWEDNVVVGGSYGSTPVRVMERDLATKSLTITSKGQSQNFEHTFTVNGAWKRANLGITAWVQGSSSDREVHNAAAAWFSTLSVSPASLGRVKALFN